jgi:hypothetical protein
MTKTVRTVCRTARRRRRQHAPGLGDRQVGVADHREVDRRALGFLDVLLPAEVVGDGIDRQADDLDAALIELALQPRD